MDISRKNNGLVKIGFSIKNGLLEKFWKIKKKIRNETLKFGYQIMPTFVVRQNERDVDLLYNFAVYFGCGYGQNNGKNRGNKVWMMLRDITDLCNIIIPFFQKHN